MQNLSSELIDMDILSGLFHIAVPRREMLCQPKTRKPEIHAEICLTA